MQEKKTLWNDRKRIIFGLPWTFTKYKLTEEKLIIQTGFLNIKQEEIRQLTHLLTEEQQS